MTLTRSVKNGSKYGPARIKQVRDTISTDWEGRNYLGLTIYWNYSEEYVEISVPDYVKKALDRLQPPNPKRPQYDPHCW